MSLFSDLQSSLIRMPNALINQESDVPLPLNVSGLPLVDGRYNATDSLLNNIKPYSGPKSSLISSDKYQQVPHRKQYPVPPIYVPEPDVTTTETVMIAMPISFGDIAFLLNGSKKQYLLSPRPYTHVSDKTAQMMPNYNCFANISTVNYLLAGLYNRIVYLHKNNLAINRSSMGRLSNAWDLYLSHFNMDECVTKLLQEHNKQQMSTMFLIAVKNLLHRVFQFYIRPFGIASHADKQGGQHEASLKPVQAAASLYTTLTVDGFNVDLNNIFRAHSLCGGDKIILRLEFFEIPQPNSEAKFILPYTLNHHSKSTICRQIMLETPNEVKLCGVFQIIPDIYSHDNAYHLQCPNIKNNISNISINRLFFDVLSDEMKQAGATESDAEKIKNKFFLRTFDYRCNGYWHVGQVYTKKEKRVCSLLPNNDTAHFGEPLLQVNWAPVYMHNNIQYDSVKNLSLSADGFDTLLKQHVNNFLTGQQLVNIVTNMPYSVQEHALKKLIENSKIVLQMPAGSLSSNLDLPLKSNANTVNLPAEKNETSRSLNKTKTSRSALQDLPPPTKMAKTKTTERNAKMQQSATSASNSVNLPVDQKNELPSSKDVKFPSSFTDELEQLSKE